MRRSLSPITGVLLLVLITLGPSAAHGAPLSADMIVSVPDQVLALVDRGKLIARYSISTSKFGTGDSAASYRTPLGTLFVSAKVGDRLPAGAVIKNRIPTGEMVGVDAPGRDAIVSRVIWLRGMEAQNHKARDRCIYIHPRAASDNFKGPLQNYGMDSAMWGYGMEVGTHAVRMMASGLFDHFPKLKICIGHMGEAVHFWLWRLNFMNTRSQKIGRAPKTKLSMDEYFRRNFVITTSGVEDHLALEYSIKKLGVDNVMWAIDYPYQPSAPAVAFMDSAPISDEDKAKLYHKNAERIFHIKPA